MKSMNTGPGVVCEDRLRDEMEQYLNDELDNLGIE